MVDVTARAAVIGDDLRRHQHDQSVAAGAVAVRLEQRPDRRDSAEDRISRRMRESAAGSARQYRSSARPHADRAVEPALPDRRRIIFDVVVLTMSLTEPAPRPIIGLPSSLTRASPRARRRSPCR